VGVLEPAFGRRKESHGEIDIELPCDVVEPHIVVVFRVKKLDLHLHARHVFTPKAKGVRAYPFIPCEVRVHDMNVSKCQQVNCHERYDFVLWIPNQGTQLDKGYLWKALRITPINVECASHECYALLCLSG
jgi:hypothetical protein